MYLPTPGRHPSTDVSFLARELRIVCGHFSQTPDSFLTVDSALERQGNILSRIRPVSERKRVEKKGKLCFSELGFRKVGSRMADSTVLQDGSTAGSRTGEGLPEGQARIAVRGDPSLACLLVTQHS